MDGHFKVLYNELIIRVSEEIEDIKHIDLDVGQLEYEVRPSVNFPALLIDFVNFTFEDLGTDNTQLAIGQINFRLVFAPFSKTSHKMSAAYKEKGLKYFDIEAALHKVLHGYTLSDGDFSEMKRVSATTEQRDDDLRVRNIVYSISFEDDSTERGYNQEPIPLHLS